MEIRISVLCNRRLILSSTIINNLEIIIWSLSRSKVPKIGIWNKIIILKCKNGGWHAWGITLYINQCASNVDDILRWNRPLTIATVYDHNMHNNNILQVITIILWRKL